MGCWDDMSYWDDEEEYCEPGGSLIGKSKNLRKNLEIL